MDNAAPAPTGAAQSDVSYTQTPEQAANVVTSPQSLAAAAATAAQPPADPAVAAAAKPSAEPFDSAKLKVSDGAAVAPEAMTKFGELAKQYGIPQEAAQQLVDLQARLSKEAADKGQAAWSTMQTEWQGKVKADPEIGGGKLTETLATISKAIDQYGTPGFREALNITGAGNNPDVVKTFWKMAKALGEGSPVTGKPPSPGRESMASRFYPNMKEG